MLIENPSNGKTAKVPMSDTGTAIIGMSVARQFCRKRKTTRMTRTMASMSVVTISLMPSVTGSVVSSETAYSRSGGNRPFSSSIVFLTPSADGQRVRSRRLKDRDDGAGLAVHPRYLLIVQRAEFDPRDILQPHHRAVRIGADHDLAELFRRLKPPCARTV